MYSFLLTFHNITRWIAVIAVIILLIKTILNLFDKAPWHPIQDKAMRWYSIALDVQFLLGLILMFSYSTMTLPAFHNFGLAIHNNMMRFFILIHPLMMTTSLVLAHIGRRKVKRDISLHKKYSQILIWFGLSFVILFLATPWPFMDVARPLFRLLNWGI